MKFFNESMILFTILISSMQVKSQAIPTGTIKGKIIDKASKQPLHAATVLIKENQKGSLTDSSGTFILSDVPEGSYSLVINFIGYQEKIINDVTVVKHKTNFVGVEIEESIFHSLK